MGYGSDQIASSIDTDVLNHEGRTSATSEEAVDRITRDLGIADPSGQNQ